MFLIVSTNSKILCLCYGFSLATISFVHVFLFSFYNSVLPELFAHACCFVPSHELTKIRHNFSKKLLYPPYVNSSFSDAILCRSQHIYPSVPSTLISPKFSTPLINDPRSIIYRLREDAFVPGMNCAPADRKGSPWYHVIYVWRERDIIGRVIHQKVDRWKNFLLLLSGVGMGKGDGCDTKEGF